MILYQAEIEKNSKAGREGKAVKVTLANEYISAYYKALCEGYPKGKANQSEQFMICSICVLMFLFMTLVGIETNNFRIIACAVYGLFEMLWEFQLFTATPFWIVRKLKFARYLVMAIYHYNINIAFEASGSKRRENVLIGVHYLIKAVLIYVMI